jgi:hypothetical protein
MNLNETTLEESKEAKHNHENAIQLTEARDSNSDAYGIDSGQSKTMPSWTTVKRTID